MASETEVVESGSAIWLTVTLVRRTSAVLRPDLLNVSPNSSQKFTNDLTDQKRVYVYSYIAHISIWFKQVTQISWNFREKDLFGNLHP